MKPVVPTYRPRASALHAARPGAAAGFCAALALPAVLFSHPLVLAAVLGGALVAAAGAQVLGEVRRALRLGVPLALLVTVVNPLVASEGTTLLVRGYVVLGRRLDVTLEELAYGGVAGLRVLALVVVFGLLSAAVDPDDLLRLFRRAGYRSALTAVVATRLVPLLARDAGRRGEAARCRPEPPSRMQGARAALGGTLDRATEVAAALEVRGYATAAPRRSRRGPGAGWSRHDLRVASAAMAVVVLAIGARVAGAAPFQPYPVLDLGLGAAELFFAAALLGLAAAPFAGAGARLGVARA